MLWPVILMALVVSQSSEAFKHFHLGRSRGGMLGHPPVNKNVTLPKEQWFKQQLDHFDPADTRIWQQRFFVNKTFYQAGGPVFLMIGGEGEISANWMVEGAWVNYAQKHNALLVQLEHRFYGKSHPTEDLSVKNLAYLSSEQALADLANFINSMRRRFELRPTSRIIVFGGSYPGSLAAWVRVKYPHLVYAAVSTSGPLIAKADFKEYYGVVQDALQQKDPKCVQNVATAIQNVKQMLTQTGQKKLAQLFQLCDPVDPNNKLDVASFFEALAGNFAEVVQYNRDNREFEGAKTANITIDVVCDLLNQRSPVKGLGDFNSMLLKAQGEKCLDFKYSKQVSDLRQTSWKSETAEGGRQWMYQTCTEFGFFQTSALPPHLFGDNFHVDYFIQRCVDVFGKKFNSTFLTAAIKNTNTFYGGLNLQGSRIVFVQGSIDPWHVLGITRTLQQGAPAIYINGTAHCANMYPESPEDPPQLKEARILIEKYLTIWLSQ